MIKRDYIETRDCFLCGSKAGILSNTDAYAHVDCPNCGEYKLWDGAERELRSKQDIRHILSGKVFESWYYNHTVTEITARDLAGKDIQIIEKLYRLAKYIFIESQKNNEDDDIKQRPACCYEINSRQYGKLLETLKGLDIIKYRDARTQDDSDVAAWFCDIKMTMTARIKFQKNIESAQQFEEVFMGTKKTGDVNVNIGGNNNAPVSIAQNHSTIAAVMNKTTISDASIIEKLRESGIPQPQIDAIRPLITEIVTEYNKEKPQQDKLHTIFSKVKEIGGIFLLNAFNFLAKPEAVVVISNLKQIVCG
jgi:predicted RNA-binding Zn-ribbon protein involved in translation (DUF1610 family)